MVVPRGLRGTKIVAMIARLARRAPPARSNKVDSAHEIDEKSALQVHNKRCQTLKKGLYTFCSLSSFRLDPLVIHLFAFSNLKRLNPGQDTRANRTHVREQDTRANSTPYLPLPRNRFILRFYQSAKTCAKGV